MRIYLAGAKDDRLESGCINLCGEATYRRLFSFFYKQDLERFVKVFQKDLDFEGGLGGSKNDGTD